MNRVFPSPRCAATGTTAGVMTHELSHLHLRQTMGSRYTTNVPGWFQEGLAVYAAHGGGAERVPVDTALEAIFSGMQIDPESRGRFIPRMAAGHKLSHHMFYRQSSMFTEYLATRWPARFKSLLTELQRGEAFSMAFA